MLEFDNRTPFSAAIMPGIDTSGRDLITVAVKGTFSLDPARDPLPPADEQLPLVWADTHWGEPGVSSVKHESEACPLKSSTDVVLIGQAYAQRGSKDGCDVSLTVGPLTHLVRVFGDRRWHRSTGSWKISSPEPFESIPLVYERAFGGADTTPTDLGRHVHERRNPIGTGMAASDANARLDGLALPNLEDPAKLIRTWDDRPAPVGFGFIGRGWSPRIDLAGTYDDQWMNDRAPLLPGDFDARFHNGAHPRLISPSYLEGGEPCEVRGATRDGLVRFSVPRRRFEILWCIRDNWSSASTHLDTVIIETDERRLTSIWRSTVPCPRQLLFVDKIVVKEGT
jgi:hypothetical protein